MRISRKCKIHRMCGIELEKKRFDYSKVYYDRKTSRLYATDSYSMIVYDVEDDELDQSAPICFRLLDHCLVDKPKQTLDVQIRIDSKTVQGDGIQMLHSVVPESEIPPFEEVIPKVEEEMVSVAISAKEIYRVANAMGVDDIVITFPKGVGFGKKCIPIFINPLKPFEMPGVRATMMSKPSSEYDLAPARQNILRRKEKK